MTRIERGPLVPRWVIRRLYAPFKPDVEQELRVQRYLYGRRTQVEVLRGRPGTTGPAGTFGASR